MIKGIVANPQTEEPRTHMAILMVSPHHAVCCWDGAEEEAFPSGSGLVSFQWKYCSMLGQVTDNGCGICLRRREKT